MPESPKEATTEGAEVPRERLQYERYDLEDVSEEMLAELEELFEQAYHNGHMYPDLLEDIQSRPEVFQLFLATAPDGRTVGVRAIESKPHKFIDYLGLPPVHGKRFTVHPDYRGHGIGMRMLEHGKRYAFEELDLPAVFGESNECGALALYGRAGAMYNLDSVDRQMRRNTREDAIEAFKIFITDPRFRKIRYPEGDGIVFAEVRDEATAELFRAHGYVSQAELLGEA